MGHELLVGKVKVMTVERHCDDSAIRVAGICILKGHHLLSGGGSVLALGHIFLKYCLPLS